MSMYEVRRNLRRLKQQERNKIKKEINLISHEQALKRYEEAFVLTFGRPPTNVKHISTKKLNTMADNLFAAAHKQELGGDDD